MIFFQIKATQILGFSIKNNYFTNLPDHFQLSVVRWDLFNWFTIQYNYERHVQFYGFKRKFLPHRTKNGNQNQNQLCS